MRSVRLCWNLEGLLAVVDFRLLCVYLLAVQENMDDLLDIADWCVHKRDCTLVCGHAVKAGRYRKVYGCDFVNIASAASLPIVDSKSDFRNIIAYVLRYINRIGAARTQGNALTLQTRNVNRTRTAHLRKVLLVVVIG